MLYLSAGEICCSYLDADTYYDPSLLPQDYTEQKKYEKHLEFRALFTSSRFRHASYTPLARFLHTPYTPLARLLHVSYTPLTRLRSRQACFRELNAMATRAAAKRRYSVYLVYWHKSTNTDAKGAEVPTASGSSMPCTLTRLLHASYTPLTRLLHSANGFGGRSGHQGENVLGGGNIRSLGPLIARKVADVC
jgi:hypothetical protein